VRAKKTDQTIYAKLWEEMDMGGFGKVRKKQEGMDLEA